MPDSMIECDGLTKRFGTFTAVDHVSFSVARASIFGFLGPNGSGKSTVIRMLCGILEPSEGAARIGSHDVSRDGQAIKDIIGYMSQKFSLYDELTVSENLTFSGKLYGLRERDLRQRRDELIAITHLEPYLDRRAAQLSGGWRQRLAMACALMHHPTVLFLDEPTAGIDPVARRELWDLLFEFAGQGMTLFVTTHYMDEAERCSHVGYIYMGRLIVCGEPDDLKQMPDVNPPGTRRLDITCDRVTTGLHAMRGVRGVSSATVFGQSMHLLVDQSITTAQIEKKLRSVGILKSDIHEIGPSLEDVFVALTAKEANNGAIANGASPAPSSRSAEGRRGTSQSQ
jgi:ABC-type multidrug transport system ATPase subunit